MNNPSQFAVARFQEGYVCSQSVLSAFAERFDLPPELAFRIASAFGAGMARRGEVCGAVTGALMVIGLEAGYTDPQDEAAKAVTNQLTEQLMQAFEARHGSILCRELLGYALSNPDELRQVREQGLFESLCPRLVEDSVNILTVLLKANE